MKQIKQTIFLCLLWMIGIGVHAEEIPNNEIWYTSSDGKVVTPNKSDAFGASIISNTYSNGKGVIKFDNSQILAAYKKELAKKDIEKEAKIRAAQGEAEAIANLRAGLNARVFNKCTGCRYCMPCPKGVDIPGNFYFYNLMYIDKKTSARFEFAQNIGIRSSGKVSCRPEGFPDTDCGGR